ncbi:hypothetical protein [Bordetella petrii]|uniref:hypothetical protein n=1 Tax=Bordetella petrii TaxID=94624 RepID=UPI0012DCE4EC|nr:hypothetical protein [Bordetella petrii]
MRLTVFEGEPGYCQYRAVRLHGLRIMVRLNGEPVAHCVTADTRRGVVVCDEVDAKGRLVLNARGDAPRRIRRFGKVEVEIAR